jgi:hypothetical protein
MKKRAWEGEATTAGTIYRLTFFAENKEFALEHLRHCARHFGGIEKPNVAVRFIGWYEDGKLPDAGKQEIIR